MLRSIAVCCCLLLCRSRLIISACDTLLAETRSGKVLGSVSTSVGGLEFCSFKGIPFAKAPLGPLRFKVSSARC